MFIEVQISLGKEYKKWVEIYGKEYTDAALSNELQLTADNLGTDFLEGHKEIYPELLKENLED